MLGHPPERPYTFNDVNFFYNTVPAYFITAKEVDASLPLKLDVRRSHIFTLAGNYHLMPQGGLRMRKMIMKYNNDIQLARPRFAELGARR